MRWCWGRSLRSSRCPRGRSVRNAWSSRRSDGAKSGSKRPRASTSTKPAIYLNKKLDEVRGHLARNVGRYDNPGFRAKADAETVAEIAEKIEDLKAQQKLLEGQIKQLG